VCGCECGSIARVDAGSLVRGWRAPRRGLHALAAAGRDGRGLSGVTTTGVPTRAVILAGGLGTRLAPYTTVFPKPLMPVAGKPVLELVLRQLRRQGIRRFTIAVSYLEELIRAFFGEGAKVGVQLDYFRE